MDTENKKVPGYNECELIADDRESLDVKQILQPKTVTYASYVFTKIQHQILVRIREELTVYLHKDFEKLNSKELIRIPLFCSHYPHYAADPKGFYYELSSLMDEKNIISFSWNFDAERHEKLYRWMMMNTGVGASGRIMLPKDGTHFDQKSVLIVNILRGDETGKFFVDINPMLAPFLLYYGEGNGGTEFNRDVALALSSRYSFRMYEYIADWSSSRTTVTKSIKELREQLLYFPASYGVNDIKRRVLDVAKSEIEEAGSSVSFEYRFKFNPEYGLVTGTRGQLGANCVEFTIVKKGEVNLRQLAHDRLLVCVQDLADREKAHVCDGLVWKIVDNGKEPYLMSKFKYYADQVKNSRIPASEYKNVMLKIIRESTGVDLRSDKHIRNAAIKERKGKGTAHADPAPVGSLFD